jgi:hypothetical protein
MVMQNEIAKRVALSPPIVHVGDGNSRQWGPRHQSTVVPREHALSAEDTVRLCSIGPYVLSPPCASGIPAPFPGPLEH